jgi:hypothetical protein
MELADAGPVRTSPNNILAGIRAAGFMLDFIWRTKRVDEAAHGPRALHAGAMGENDTGGAREIPGPDERTLRTHGIPGDRIEVLKFRDVIAAEDLGPGGEESTAALSRILFHNLQVVCDREDPGNAVGSYAGYVLIGFAIYHALQGHVTILHDDPNGFDHGHGIFF